MTVDELKEELSVYEKRGLSMSVEQLREVFRLYAIFKSGIPILCKSDYGNFHKYDRIRAIRIHEFNCYADGIKIGISGELLDENSRSVISIPAERIRLIDNRQSITENKE